MSGENLPFAPPYKHSLRIRAPFCIAGDCDQCIIDIHIRAHHNRSALAIACATIPALDIHPLPTMSDLSSEKYVRSRGSTSDITINRYRLDPQCNEPEVYAMQSKISSTAKAGFVKSACPRQEAERASVFSFAGLPRELRDMVYDQYILEHDVYVRANGQAEADVDIFVPDGALARAGRVVALEFKARLDSLLRAGMTRCILVIRLGLCPSLAKDCLRHRMCLQSIRDVDLRLPPFPCSLGASCLGMQDPIRLFPLLTAMGDLEILRICLDQCIDDYASALPVFKSLVDLVAHGHHHMPRNLRRVSLSAGLRANQAPVMLLDQSLKPGGRHWTNNLVARPRRLTWRRLSGEQIDLMTWDFASDTSSGVVR